MSNPQWVQDPIYVSRQPSPTGFSPWFQAEKPQAKPSFSQWQVPTLDAHGDAAPTRQTPEEKPAASKPPAAERDMASTHADSALPEADAPRPPEPKGGKTNLPAISDAEYEAAQKRSFAEGVAEGRAQVLKTVAADKAQREALSKAISSQWQFFKNDTERWYDPLKRLSLHIAEQLVRAELRLSGDAIAGLIQQCAETIDHAKGLVLVEVNPADLERLQKMKIQWPSEWRFEASATLSEGSVRMRTDDAEVEDLIENRLSHLARQLLGTPTPDRPAHQSRATSMVEKEFESHDVADVQDLQHSSAMRVDDHEGSDFDEVDTLDAKATDAHTNDVPSGGHAAMAETQDIEDAQVTRDDTDPADGARAADDGDASRSARSASADDITDAADVAGDIESAQPEPGLPTHELTQAQMGAQVDGAEAPDTWTAQPEQAQTPADTEDAAEPSDTQESTPSTDPDDQQQP